MSNNKLPNTKDSAYSLQLTASAKNKKKSKVSLVKINRRTILPSKLVKIGDAAQILGVSIDTLRRWEKAGKISAIRTPGGTRLYSIKALRGMVNVDDRRLKMEDGKILSSNLYPQNTTLYSPSSTVLPSSSNSYFEDEFSQAQEIVRSALAEQNTKIATEVNLNSNIKIKKVLLIALAKTIPALILILVLTSSALYLTHPQTAKTLTGKILGLAQIPNQLKPQSNKPQAEVLAASSGDKLEINTDLTVSGAINGLGLQAADDGFAIAGGNNARVLTVTGGDVTLDQDLSKASSPTFDALNLNTLKLAATSKQISIGSTGTLTWTPTGTQTITLPDATGTVVLNSNTQTLTNKSLSGSSNTFTSIPNSALTNHKITISAGTNLTGGGDINLGESASLALKSTIALTAITLGDGTAAAPAYSFTSDTDTGLYRLGTDSIGLVVGGSATKGITLNSSGYLGVGTITPGGALSVNGGASIGTYSGTAPPGNGLIVSGNVGLGTSAPQGALDVLNGVLFVSTAGNVGIGTTSPTGTLVVNNGSNTYSPLIIQDNGSAVFTIGDGGTTITWTGTTLTASSLATLTTAASLAMSSTTGLTLGDNSTVYGGDNESGTLTLSSTSHATKGNLQFFDANSYITSAGALTIASNLDVNGTTNDIAGTLNLSGGALTSTGALTITPQAGNNLNIALSTTGDFAVNTNQLYVDTSAGNVGIGITSPGYKLEVKGDTGLKVTPDNWANVGNPGSQQNSHVLLTPRGFSFSTDDTTLSSSYQPSLGIGLAMSRSNPALAIKNAGGPSIIIESGNIGFGNTSPTGAIHVGNATTPSFFVASTNGNVGMGTNSPGTKLEVTGNIVAKTTSPLIYTESTATGENAIQMWKSSGGTRNYGWNLYSPDGGYDLRIAKRTTDVDTNVLTLQNASGNVGIGTTSPLALNHIVQTGAADALRVDDAAGDTSYFVVDQFGNVGIGTTKPGVKLDISGNARITGSLMALSTNLSSLPNNTSTLNINKNIAPNASDSWSTGTSGGTARYFHASTLYNGKIYYWGGYNDSNLNTVDIYDIASDSWSTGTSGGTGRQVHTGVLYNGKIYYWGGYNGSYLTSVDIYDIASDSWSTGTSGGTARDKHTGVLYNGKIYYWGGVASNGVTRLTSVDIYDIASDSWSTGTSGGTARDMQSADLYNGKIYYWGGYNSGNLNTVDIYDIASDSWSTGTSGGTARQYPTGTIYNGKIYYWGGYGGSYLNTVDIYDIASDSWSTGTSGGTGRIDTRAVFYNGKIYYWGGNNGSTLNSMDIYDIGKRQDIFALQENGSPMLTFETGRKITSWGNLLIRAGTLNSNQLFLTTSGNVGIGTTSPLALNHIVQTGAADALRVDDAAGDTSYFVVDQYGNVGIGNTAPTYKLDVSGTARLGATQVTGAISASTGSLDIGSSGTRFGTGYFDTIDASNLSGVITGAGTNNPSWTINQDNNTDDTEAMSLAFERGNTSPNAVLGWDYTNDEFDFNSGINITGTIASTNGLTLSSFTNDIVTPTDEHLSLMPGGTGNVGIGTTSPLSLLQLRTIAGSDPSFSLADADVEHGVTTIAPTNDFLRVVPISSTAGGAYLQGLADATGVALQLRGIQSSDPTDSTPAIKLIGAKADGTGVQDLGATETIFQVANNDDAAALTILGNGNVGIGTTNPSDKLEIIGNLLVGLGSSTQRISLGNIGNAIAFNREIANGGIFNSSNTAYQMTHTTGSSGILEFQVYTTAGTQVTDRALVINVSGNIGIGTTAPAAKFDVRDGKVVLTDADVSQPISDVWPASVFGQMQPYSDTAGGLRINGISDTDASGLVLVGIMGSADPTDSTPAMIFIADKYLSTSATQALGNGETAFQFRNESSNLLTIIGNGNVGIGTTNPGAKLELYGSSIEQRIVDAAATGNPKLSFYQTTLERAYFQYQDIDDSFDINTDSHIDFMPNNTQSMRIDSAGNVGIGTTNPQNLLNLVKATPPTTVTAADMYLKLGSLEYSANSYRLIGFGYNSSSATNVPAYLGYQEISTTGDSYGDLVFGTRSVTTNTAASERMRITGAGNIGIGTTAPLRTLEINGRTRLDDFMEIYANSATQGYIGSYAQIVGSGPYDTTIYANTGNILLANANVGIGTTNPGQKLRVEGNISAFADASKGFLGEDASGNDIFSLTRQSNGLSITSYDFIGFTDSQSTPSTSYNMFIDGGNVGIGTTSPSVGTRLSVMGGNVGIGTTSPSVLTEIASSIGTLTTPTNVTNLRVRNDGSAGNNAGIAITSGNTGSSYLLMGDNDNDDIGFIEYNQTSNFMGFTTNSTERIRITSSGNIGIGTTVSNISRTTIAGGSTTTGLAFLVQDSAYANRFAIQGDGNVGIGTTGPAYKFDLASTSATGYDFRLANNSLNTGNLAYLSSTSIALTTGSLMALDWSPTGSTEIYATGDLFSINAGEYANVGNLLNLKDNGSSVFSISQTAVTTSLPTSFNAAGDISIAYDLNFTNPTTSNIKSAAPINITAGESFNSSDLTLGTYNAGSVIVSQANAPTAAGTSYALQILPTLTSSTNSMTYTALYGNYNIADVNLSGDAATDLTTLYSNYTGLTATAGTIGTWYGNYIAAPTGSGTVTNKYALATEGSAGNVGIGTTVSSISRMTVSGLGTAAGLSFLTQDSAGTNRFAIQDNGNVGIGTTAPAALLDVAGNVNVGSNATIQSASSNLMIKTPGSGTLNLNTGTTGIIQLNPGGNTAMTILNNGNVGIGTTAPAHKLDVVGTAGLSTGTLWTNTSDSRVKQNIETIPDALGIIDQLKPSQYLYTPEYLAAHPEIKNVEHFGFIAQDFQEVFPDWVTTGSDGYLQVNASNVIPYAVKAIQEQQSQLSDLNTNQATSSAAIASLQSSTVNHELITVNSNGNVGIGTTDPGAYKLYVNGPGYLADTGWTYASDRRLKENINGIGSGLAVINALNPVTFDYINGSKDRSGFIAQEVAAVLPSIVSQRPDGMLSLRTDEILPYAVDAIKELNAQIAAIKDSLKIEADGTLNVAAIKTDKLLISTQLSDISLQTNGSSLTTVEPNPDSGSYTAPATQAQYVDLAGRITERDEYYVSSIKGLADKVKELEDKVATLSAQATAVSGVESVAGEATSSSQLTAYSLQPESTSSAVSDLNLTPPEVLLTNTSASLVDLSVTSEATFSGQLTAYKTTISDTFKSLGNTFLGNTTIAGDFSVDGTMSITGSSINAVSCPSANAQGDKCGVLNIQNSPLATLIDFFNGAVTIDKAGTLAVNKIELPAEVLGEAIIAKGQLEIPVFTNAITSKSKIFLTPLSNLGGQNLTISDIVPGSGFVVTLGTALNTETRFNWLIIDNK